MAPLIAILVYFGVIYLCYAHPAFGLWIVFCWACLAITSQWWGWLGEVCERKAKREEFENVKRKWQAKMR